MAESADTSYLTVHIDSKGKILKQSLNNEYDRIMKEDPPSLQLPQNLNIQVKFKSGEKIKGTYGRLKRSHKQNPKQVHYFASGSNNMTRRRNHQTYVCHYTDDALFNSVADPINDIVEDWSKEIPECKLHLCTITAVNVENATVNAQPGDQDRVNRKIWGINTHVHGKNKEMGVKTCWLSRFVHVSNNGKYSHWYDRLQEDGVHPTDMLVDKWAHEILKHYANCVPNEWK